MDSTTSNSTEEVRPLKRRKTYESGVDASAPPPTPISINEWLPTETLTYILVEWLCTYHDVHPWLKGGRLTITNAGGTCKKKIPIYRWKKEHLKYSRVNFTFAAGVCRRWREILFEAFRHRAILSIGPTADSRGIDTFSPARDPLKYLVECAFYGYNTAAFNLLARMPDLIPRTGGHVGVDDSCKTDKYLYRAIWRGKNTVLLRFILKERTVFATETTPVTVLLKTAAKCGDMETFRMAIKTIVDRPGYDRLSFGSNIAPYAIRYGTIPMVKMVMNTMVSFNNTVPCFEQIVDREDSDGYTVIAKIIQKGHCDMMRYMLRTFGSALLWYRGTRNSTKKIAIGYVSRALMSNCVEMVNLVLDHVKDLFDGEERSDGRTVSSFEDPEEISDISLSLGMATVAVSEAFLDRVHYQVDDVATIFGMLLSGSVEKCRWFENRSGMSIGQYIKDSPLEDPTKDVRVCMVLSWSMDIVEYVERDCAKHGVPLGFHNGTDPGVYLEFMRHICRNYPPYPIPKWFVDTWRKEVKRPSSSSLPDGNFELEMPIPSISIFRTHLLGDPGLDILNNGIRGRDVRLVRWALDTFPKPRDGRRYLSMAAQNNDLKMMNLLYETLPCTSITVNTKACRIRQHITLETFKWLWQHRISIVLDHSDDEGMVVVFSMAIESIMDPVTRYWWSTLSDVEEEEEG